MPRKKAVKKPRKRSPRAKPTSKTKHRSSSKPTQAKTSSPASGDHASALRPFRTFHTFPTFRTSISNLLILLGLTLIGLWASHTYFYLKSLTPPASTTSTTSVNRAPSGDPATPSHIFIPWKVDVDIAPAIHQDNDWYISPDQAAHVVDSALPGDNGNIIIFGHNTRAVMGNIRALTGGETITLTLSDGSTKAYRVESTHQVTPADTSFLKPTTEETLTLYTCAGFWDRERFIAVAKPIEP